MNDATYLRQAIVVLRERIRLRLSGEKAAERHEHAVLAAEKALEEVRNGLSRPPALERVAKVFGLTDFERDVLVLCAGVELDPELPELVQQWQGGRGLARPTFACASAMLEGAHWDASSLAGPLRTYELIQWSPPTDFGPGPLFIRERVLHALLGMDEFDGALRSYMFRQTMPEVMAPSHLVLATSIVETLRQKADMEWPAIVISGDDVSSKRALAVTIAHSLGRALYSLRANDLPSDPGARQKLSRLWACETRLSPCALYVDADWLETSPALLHTQAFAESLSGLMFLSGKWSTSRSGPTLHVHVKPLSAPEQRSLWKDALGMHAALVDGQLNALVANFSLRAGDIADIVNQAVMQPEATAPGVLAKRLWESCCERARPRLNDLADRIDAAASWEDLVLPTQEIQTLRRIVARARQRYQVLHDWGFAKNSSRGLGSSVLFAGVSGTGKTMAAEILANELHLDLYRVDLSRVVSKYIGETEKNLARIFDAADEGGVVLLFDEADALFGKRSDVKDSHDRYANIEVSYLLQRIESYLGVAILTTNLKQALDTAFLRRLRYVVTFPFPDFAQRAEIWKRVFPRQTPMGGLDFDKLAQLALAGGNIRNIALNAAFCAADAGEPVGMAHIREAAREECLKLDRSVLLPEIDTWM